MIVFRLSKALYARDLSGRGAEKSGGRWNSRGVPMLYTSASRALCTVEIAVHTPLGNIPSGYQIISLEIPDDSLFELPLSDLPDDWKSFPHPNSTQKLGDTFLQDQMYVAMKVPSAVVQGDFNYLLNPVHADFAGVKIVNIEPFEFDERLFVR